MDPASAIGVASGILAFIDFGFKIINGTVRIYGSSKGLYFDEFEDIAEKFDSLARRLQPPTLPHTEEEQRTLDIAASCQTLAKELAEIFHSLCPKDLGSRSQRAWAAVRLKMKEGQTQELEQRLGRYRDQFQLILLTSNYLTGRDMERALQRMIQSHDTPADQLRRLVANVEEVNKAISQGIPCLTNEAIAQLKQATALQDDKIDTIACSRILKCLAFDSIQDRYKQIEHAHKETFAWFFDGTPSEELQKPQSEARILLHRWLTEGSGILHVSGKLGCGKSTLMKFLVGHFQTKAALRAWAGNDNTLIFESFYFWRPGSSEQKSLIGLLRSLLHDVLRTEPGLASCAFPDIWQEVRACPWQADPHIKLTNKDIQQALENVVQHCKATSKYRLCFFIDGLDEYVETRQFDHRDMVNMLHQWTHADQAPSRIKICVSSREDNVFMKHFPDERRIRLHNLTKHDMTRFCLDKLSHVFDSRTLSNHVDLVVEKAQGIFLWVGLVVQEMRRQYEHDYDTLEDVESFLELVPRELTELYRYILDNLLKPEEKYKAHCTFAVMTKCLNALGLDLLLWQYSFLSEYIEKPRIDPTGRASPPRGEINKAESRLQKAKAQLNGWCRGLVEILGPDSDSNTDSKSDPSEPEEAIDEILTDALWVEQQKLVFAHRSIPEFLATAEIQEERRRLFEIGRFDVLETLSQLVLYGIQSMDGRSSSSMHVQLLAIVDLRARSGVASDREPPFRFLQALDCVHETWMTEIMMGSREGGHPIGLGTFRALFPRKSANDLVPKPVVDIANVIIRYSTTHQATRHGVARLMVNSACQLLWGSEPHPYPLWVVDNLPLDADSHVVPLMVCTALQILQEFIFYPELQSARAKADQFLGHVSHSDVLKTLVAESRGYTFPRATTSNYFVGSRLGHDDPFSELSWPLQYWNISSGAIAELIISGFSHGSRDYLSHVCAMVNLNFGRIEAIWICAQDGQTTSALY